MIGFTIKKWFFDYWDNFFVISLVNIGFLGIFAIPIYGAAPFFDTAPLISPVIFSLGFLLASLYIGTIHAYGWKIASYGKPELREFWEISKSMLKPSLIIGTLWLVIVITLFFVVPFYGSLAGQGNLLGFGALAFLFWIGIIVLLSSQYFFPVYTQLDKDLKKVFKKSFIIFFDNSFFSLFLGIFSLIVFVLSTFTAFLILGPGSIILLGQVGLKLRLYKYDYLQEHPEVKRKDIPWRALLIDDEDRVGKRSLRGLIFPWKE